MKNDQVIIHTKTTSYRVIEPKVNNNIIVGKIQLIADTNNWLYKNSLEYAKESEIFPLQIYSLALPSELIQHNDNTNNDIISIKPSDVSSVKLYLKKTLTPNEIKARHNKILYYLFIVLILYLIILRFGLFYDGRCYIATMVYGSYDAPQVLVLRRYRDEVLLKHIWGKLFVKNYYTFSPLFVRVFKHVKPVHQVCKYFLDKMVAIQERRFTLV